MRRKMWIRRIVSTTVLLALLALVVFGVVKAAGLIGTLLSDRHSAATVASQPTSVSIAACTADDIHVAITADPYAAAVGEGLRLDLVIENKAATECSLALADLKVRLSSGDYTVWTPSDCASGWDKTLLLSPKVPWETSLKWDGRIYESCDLLTNDEGTGLVADAGTYKVQVAVGKTWLDSPLTFQVQ